jgi:hypothetical protein
MAGQIQYEPSGPDGQAYITFGTENSIAIEVGQNSSNTRGVTNNPADLEILNYGLTPEVFRLETHRDGGHVTSPLLSGPGVTAHTFTVPAEHPEIPGRTFIEPGAVSLPISLNVSHAALLVGQAVYLKDLTDPAASQLVPIKASINNTPKPAFIESSDIHGAKLTHTGNEWTVNLGVRPAGGWATESFEVTLAGINAAKGPSDPMQSRLDFVPLPTPRAAGQDFLSVNFNGVATTIDINHVGVKLAAFAPLDSGNDGNRQLPTQFLQFTDHGR